MAEALRRAGLAGTEGDSDTGKSDRGRRRT
jgi:hypothetical protein